jgi:hypothetical protein
MPEVEVYRKFADTALIEELLRRLAITSDLEAKAMLFERVIGQLDVLRLKFPDAAALADMPEIRQSGDIRVGSVVHGNAEIGPFLLSNTDLNRNVLVVASVGHGKTSLVYNILGQLDSSGVNFIIFDPKGDYKSMAFKEDTVYLDGNFRINPLQPPDGVDQKEWLVHFSDVFSHCFALLVGSRDFLLDSLLSFFAGWESDVFPSLKDFYLYLDSLKAHSEYLKVVKGRIKALISSSDVFNCSRGLSFSSLVRYNVILELYRFGLLEQSFLFSLVLSQIFHLKLVDRSGHNGLKTVIAVDDAHHIIDANKERDFAMGLPIIHGMIAKLRELGVGFIFADQQISSVLSTTIQNTNIKFIGRINLVEDLRKISGRNTADALEDTISSLGIGEFVVLSPNVRPFCVLKADHVNIEKDMNDTSLELASARYADVLSFSLPYTDVLEETKRREENVIRHISALAFVSARELMESGNACAADGNFNELYNSLISHGIIKEMKIRTFGKEVEAFPFVCSEAKELVSRRFKKGEIKTWSDFAFKKELFRSLVRGFLLEKGIDFSEFDTGLLLRRPQKVYITFLEGGPVLAGILETRFDSVINVIDETVNGQELLTNIKRLSRDPAVVNLDLLRLCTLENFSPFDGQKGFADLSVL